MKWLGHGLALLAGMIAPLAFAPFHYYPLAIVSLLLLFLAWDGVSAKVAAIRGLLFGIGLFGVGVSWVFVAIHVFGQASMLLAGLLTALFVVILALYTAGLGYVLKRLCHNRHFSLRDYILLLPVGWFAFEWLKAWLFTGFPWLEFGVSQIEGPLSGYIPIIGALGVSWLVALSAALLAYSWQKKQLISLLWVVAIWSGGAGLQTIDWTTDYGEPLQVSIIQGNVPQEIKWNKEQVVKTLSLYQQKTEENWQSDIIVWPENAVTAFYHQVKPFFLDPLTEMAIEHKTTILAGLPIYQAETKQYYNGMVSLGEQLGFYHKRHLVPFGDYIPFEWLRGLIAFFDLPMSSFAKGAEDQGLLTAAGHAVGVSICYEDVFSNEVLSTVPAATILVNATNNAWYGDSFAPHQHLQISQNRALETGRPIIRATTNGISALIDHHGRFISTSPQFELAVLTDEIQAQSGETPYVRWQRWPIFAGMLFMLLLWAYYRRLDHEV